MATFDSKTIVMMAENGHSVEIDGKKIQMTIVQEAVEAKPDYSHLVGKWVRCVDSRESDKFTIGKYYPVVGDLNEVSVLIDNKGEANGFFDKNPKYFDLSNPLDHNPDDVRVFDVPSEIKISSYLDSLNLHFGEHQCLVYSKEKHCYGVFASSEIFKPISCIATECKFEDLKEGDLFFATDSDEPDFTNIHEYNFLNGNRQIIWTNGCSVYIAKNHFDHYFKITPKP